MIVDTSALLAFFDRDEPDHGAVSDILEGATEPLAVSPYVLAELDYLVASRLGVQAELVVLQELSGGAWELPAMDREDVRRAASIIERYADQRLGIADASIILLAERYRTRTILTLDRRHFGVVRPLDGGRFTILP